MRRSYLKKVVRRLIILNSQLSQLPQDLARQISILGARSSSLSETKIPLEVLVIIHAYWPEQFTVIIRHLNEIKMPLSIVVTIPVGENAIQIENLLATISKHHSVKFIGVENVGRDVGPFLTAIDTFANRNWDLVIKVHTKASQNIWFECLVKSLLRSDRRIRRYVTIMKRFPRGLIVHPYFRYPGHKQPANEPAMIRLRNSLNLNNFQVPKKWYFAAGSMFASSSIVMMAVKQEGENLHLIKFEEEENYFQGSAAHVYERFVGLYACAKGDGLISTSIIDFFDLKALKTKMK
jgi:lipopolysaccharide biosynthesis protein